MIKTSVANELAKQALTEFEEMENANKNILQTLNDIGKSKNIKQIGVAEGRGLIYAQQYNKHKAKLERLLNEIIKS